MKLLSFSCPKNKQQEKAIKRSGLFVIIPQSFELGNNTHTKKVLSHGGRMHIHTQAPRDFLHTKKKKRTNRKKKKKNRSELVDLFSG